ncbi:hypothetical protein [Methylobacter sp.]
MSGQPAGKRAAKDCVNYEENVGQYHAHRERRAPPHGKRDISALGK